MSATRPTTAITVRLVGPKQRGAHLPMCPRPARHPGRLQHQQSWARNIMAQAGAGLTEVYLVTSDLQATKTALGASVLRRATSMVANQRRSFTHWAVAFRYPPPGPLYEVHEAGPHPVTGRVIAMRSFQTFEEINNESSEVSATRPTTAITVRLVGPKQRGAHLPVCPRPARHPGRLQHQQSWARNIMAQAGAAGHTKVYLITTDLDKKMVAAGAAALTKLTSSVRHQEDSFKHWAIALRYAPPGALYEVVEAGPHRITGRIVATTSLQTLEELNNEASEMKVLRSFVISRQEAAEAVAALSSVGEYHLLTQNCQAFARRLLTRLKVPLPSDVITAESAFLEAALAAFAVIVSGSALRALH
nr:uncharacterized protein LOC129380249 isoform X1 [Dermacentor andersoni]XP_054927926.1 uncharacterized protein LOC129380249 isoform X1 [Dermacentor andersoni]